MHDIFLSYASDDVEIARAFANVLETHGWSVWWAPQIRPGAKFRREIDEAIEAARCFIVLWSSRSVESDWVLSEADDGRTKPGFIPVAIDSGLRLPRPYGQYHTVELLDWSGDHRHPTVRTVVERVRAIVPPGPGSDSQPTEEPVVHSPPRVELKPGDTFRDGPHFPEMVVVPDGRFLMGSADNDKPAYGNERPQHEVTIARPFAIGKYPVTFAEWDAFVSAGGTKHRPDDQGWGRDTRPVINVSWEDAQAYVAWLTERTSRPYRLPSEPEWEYAARADTTTSWPWGDQPGSGNANFLDSGSQWSGKSTSPVGSFPPNAFGLYDMIGNVWEWTGDAWHPTYAGAPVDGSAWTSDGKVSRVLRGGSWLNLHRDARAASRNYVDPGSRNHDVGFRVLLSSPIFSSR